MPTTTSEILACLRAQDSAKGGTGAFRPAIPTPRIRKCWGCDSELVDGCCPNDRRSGIFCRVHWDTAGGG